MRNLQTHELDHIHGGKRPSNGPGGFHPMVKPPPGGGGGAYHWNIVDDDELIYGVAQPGAFYVQTPYFMDTDTRLNLSYNPNSNTASLKASDGVVYANGSINLNNGHASYEFGGQTSLSNWHFKISLNAPRANVPRDNYLNAITEGRLISWTPQHQ